MAQPIAYLSKHPFQGDVRQSQLSFPKGATINAKPNQDGAWWWGSYNGKEGWFPPAYVTATGPSPSPRQPTAYGSQQQQQASMQQRMQNATFAPSVKQQQQARPPAMQTQQMSGFQPATLGFNQSSPAFGQPQQQQKAFGQPSPFQATGGLGTVRPQQRYEPSDPFAGLENMNAVTPMPAPSLGGSGNATPTNTQAASQAQQYQQPLSTSFQKESLPAPSQLQQQAPAYGGTGSSSSILSQGSMSTQGTAANLSVSTAPSKDPSFATAPLKMAPALSQQTSQTPRERSKSPSVTQRARSGSSNSTGTKSPKAAAKQTLSPPTKSIEEEARLREKEEARQKAQRRKEKEEMRREREQLATGIGSSGVAFQDASMTGNAAGLALEPTFNPYDFLAGTSSLPTRQYSPIFRVPPFRELMNLETYVRRFPLTKEQLSDRAAAYQQLANALSFQCHIVVESEAATKAGRGRFSSFRSGPDQTKGPLNFLKFNHLACEACIKLISILPHSAGASGKALDGLFLNFINVFVSLIEKLQPNQQIVVPGGWQQPESFHLCLYIVRRVENDKFTFTVCNTGKDGLQYHPSTFDSETGRQLKQLAMTIWDIPAKTLLDSTFWTILLRMQVYPSRKNTAEFLYTKLLPALNAQPLRSNLDQGPADYLEIPHPISASTYHPLAKLAMTTTPQIGARTSKYSSLLLMNAAADLAYAEIENAPASSMDPEDTRILKLTGRNLANFASSMDANTVGDGTLGTSLSSTWDLLDKLQKKINLTSSKPMDQYTHGLPKSALSDDFSKGIIKTMRTDPGSLAYPFFGRLRRDNYEEVVKNLMGDPRPDPILIPAVLTDDELPPKATDFATAASSLQRVADACSLLLQQRRIIKNSPAFAASAAQYAITVLLPMPNSDARYCFWRKDKMRRETQLNLLSLIRRICRIYSAATACVQQSRGLVAIRSITLACATCVADAICRVKACDDPSTFALHYSGKCEGPTQPFAIEAGSFDTLGSNLPIYDPNLCSLRFRCLDYLRDTMFNMHGVKRNTIFNFDASLKPMEGDLVLITQLSIQLALALPHPRTDEAMANHAANLISGRNGSIIEVLPEFECFRDIIFHFKHSVSGQGLTAADVPENQAWLPSNATLHWNAKRKTKDDPMLFYEVTAFNGHVQDFVDFVAQAPKFENEFRGFLSLFSSKKKAVRARLSSADPTTVVNSCGDKFINKKYVSLSCVFEGVNNVSHPLNYAVEIQKQTSLGAN